MNRIIDDHNGLNEEAEQFIEKIEYISMEEEKLYDINDEYIPYDREYNGFQITIRDNTRTVMGKLKTSMEGRSYKSVSKKTTIYNE